MVLSMTIIELIIISAGAVVVLMAILDRILTSLGITPNTLYNAIMMLSGLLCVIAHMVSCGGILWAGIFLTCALLIPSLFEIVGIRTGIPFGKYQYLPGAGPRLYFGVPVSIVLMWVLLLYSGVFIGLSISELIHFEPRGFSVILIGSFVVVFWDLIGDPVSVHGMMWRWLNGGKWYGVPLSNFFGWFLVAMTTLTVILLLSGSFPSNSGQSRTIFYLPVFLTGFLHYIYFHAAYRRKFIFLSILSGIAGTLYLGLYILTLNQY